MASASPGNVILDTVAGSSFTLEASRVVRVRTATITNINVAAGQALMLEEAYIALNAQGLALNTGYPDNPDWTLQRIRVTPLDGTSARAELFYSTPDWGTPSAYIITDSTVLKQVETQFMPGTSKQPFMVSYDAQKAASYSSTASPAPTNQTPISQDAVTLSIMIPVRQLTITQLQFGNPDEVSNAPTSGGFGSIGEGTGSSITSLRASVKYVNGDTFLGLNKGYWLMMGYTTRISVYQGTYVSEATISTNGDEDWSVYGILQNRQTGQYADTSDATGTGGMTAAQGAGYSYGIIYNSAGYGVIRVGPYPTTSFTTLFPSLTSGTPFGPNGLGW